MNRKQAITASLLLFATSLCAQNPPAVPLPSQLSTAHTVFLAPGEATSIPNVEDYVSLMYTSTYRMLNTINYKMVTTPSDADLSMEISVVTTPPIVSGASSFTYLQLVLRDVKTHTLIWTIQAPLKNDFRAKSIQRGLDDAEARIAVDLKALISGSLPISPSTIKTRASQEKQ